MPTLNILITCGAEYIGSHTHPVDIKDDLNKVEKLMSKNKKLPGLK